MMLFCLQGEEKNVKKLENQEKDYKVWKGMSGGERHGEGDDVRNYRERESRREGEGCKRALLFLLL